MTKSFSKLKSGKITPHGVKLEPHEWGTVLFFTNLGKDVELIPASHTPGDRRADIFMDGLAWENKSPIKCQRRTIERVFYNASRQSSNIIIDLRRAIGKEDAIATLVKCFQNTRRVRNLYIITKDGTLEIHKKVNL